MSTVKGTLIDEGAVGRNIDVYVEKNGEMPRYIIMSASTVSLIESSRRKARSSTSDVLEFHGVAVAVCNVLSLGEYEIV